MIEISMFTRTVTLKICALIFLMTGMFTSNSHATELNLVFKNEDGKPVAISKAELLLVAWGYTETIKLETQGTSLRLPLDESWLRSRAPERFQDLEGVYLYLQSSGLASIRSDRFKWMGSGSEASSEARIKFPGLKEVIINQDSIRTLGIIFRKPQEKYVKFIDDENRPFPGVKIKISMFWSDSNHCGQLGANYLSESVSDENGVVAVPDGDIEYAIEIMSRNAAFKNPDNSAFPNRKILYINANTALQLHHRTMKPLTLQVVHDGAPVTDEILFACLNDCREGSCGSCCGFLQKTDSKGIINLTDFYPEMYNKIFFARPAKKKSLNETVPLWEMKPLIYSPNDIIKVDLK